jgi:uncharacterized membrane protein
MAALLAALSAATFGVGDFFGGLSARRMASVLTTLTAQATGLALIVAACFVITGDPRGADLALGAGAGLAGALGLVLFYWAMAKGPMSVVAPVSAVTSALVPVTAGVAAGERPSVLAMVGIVLGLPAIVLISREPTPAEALVSERVVERSVRVHASPRLVRVGGLPVVAATLSGVGFGVFFTLLSHTSEGSGLWPVAAARSAAVCLALLMVLALRPGRPVMVGVRFAVIAGCLDSVGNSLYLFATRHGLLTLVGVVGAMYPASTVVLARIVLREQMARHQLAGLAVAVLAVTLIALG